MIEYHFDHDHEFEWLSNKKKHAYLNEMIENERLEAINQLKLYRDELMSFLGFKSIKDTFINLDELERSRQNLRLYNELIQVTNTIIKYEQQATNSDLEKGD